jgi:nucleoside-diphosphate kinase
MLNEVNSMVTFAMIKPDAVEKNHSGKIIDLIEANGFSVVKIKKFVMPKALAEAFYQVHSARPFYGELVDFITSGPVVALALSRNDAVEQWRNLMGATNPSEASEGTVRKLFGESIGKNASHGSDSSENAIKELSLIFQQEHWL